MFDKNYKIDDLMEFDKKYMLHTTMLKKVRFAYGEGSKLYTPCSKQFIDFGSAAGANSLGYGHPKFIKGISEQGRDLMRLCSGYLIEPQVLLAKKLVELSGYDMRVLFANSTKEANACAIKIARKFGNGSKNKIILLGVEFYERVLKENDCFDGNFVCAKDIDSLYNLANDEICGVFIEFSTQTLEILGATKSKITDVARFLKQKNILLMVQENGVYRSGEMFVSSLYGISPDVLVCAGGFGAGVNITALMCGLKDGFVCDESDDFLEGNFLSPRAGLLTLEILQEEYQNGNLKKTIDAFNTQTDKILKDFPNLFQKKLGVGLMLELVTKDKTIQKNIIKNAFEEQLLICDKDDRVRFLPALNISADEISEGFVRFHKACEKI